MTTPVQLVRLCVRSMVLRCGGVPLSSAVTHPRVSQSQCSLLSFVDAYLRLRCGCARKLTLRLYIVSMCCCVLWFLLLVELLQRWVWIYLALPCAPPTHAFHPPFALFQIPFLRAPHLVSLTRSVAVLRFFDTICLSLRRYCQCQIPVKVNRQFSVVSMRSFVFVFAYSTVLGGTV